MINRFDRFGENTPTMLYINHAGNWGYRYVMTSSAV